MSAFRPKADLVRPFPKCAMVSIPVRCALEAAMRRREFICFFGSVAAAWPLAALAQQSAMPVIGFINAAPAQSYGPQLTAFLKGLDEKGYADGHNVTIEYRWAEGHNDRLPSMAADLVRR